MQKGKNSGFIFSKNDQIFLKLFGCHQAYGSRFFFFPVPQATDLRHDLDRINHPHITERERDLLLSSFRRCNDIEARRFTQHIDDLKDASTVRLKCLDQLIFLLAPVDGTCVLSKSTCAKN